MTTPQKPAPITDAQMRKKLQQIKEYGEMHAISRIIVHAEEALALLTPTQKGTAS